MKTFLVLLMTLVCCGRIKERNTDPGTPINDQPGQVSEPCTTTQISGGAKITCPDGTSSVIKNGTPGTNGSDGAKGDAGAQGSTGDPGATGDQGIQGPMGPVGPEGVAGANGQNGTSCTVAYTSVGAVLACPDGSTVNILNGVDGHDNSSVTAVKLCRDSSAGYPEYGFLIGGNVYAVYYGYIDGNGNPSNPPHGTLEAFMSRLSPGTYMSTNGTGCTFSIDTQGNVVN